MAFTYEKGKKLNLTQLYRRKSTRLARIEMLKSEIRTIERIIKEKEEK